MKLSEIKQILNEREWMLTKSLGQNFLHDQNQLQRIAQSAELTREDKVLEIGPGLGPLTELLTAQAGQVLAIEKDQRMFSFLQEKYAATPTLTLLHEDALRYVEQHRDWQDWKLVANLPYSVASPILVELALSPNGPRAMVATLQWEVAQRLMAETDAEDYGVLTLLIQLHYEAITSFKIPSECFFPEPGVDSACVVLRRRPVPLLSHEQTPLFVRVVKKAFSQRRKMMLKLLKQEWPTDKLIPALEALHISLQERAEKVSLEQFVALTEALA